MHSNIKFDHPHLHDSRLLVIHFGPSKITVSQFLDIIKTHILIPKSAELTSRTTSKFQCGSNFKIISQCLIDANLIFYVSICMSLTTWFFIQQSYRAANFINLFFTQNENFVKSILIGISAVHC